jgi:hypothetical protein
MHRRTRRDDEPLRAPGMKMAFTSMLASAEIGPMASRSNRVSQPAACPACTARTGGTQRRESLQVSQLYLRSPSPDARVHGWSHASALSRIKQPNDKLSLWWVPARSRGTLGFYDDSKIQCFHISSIRKGNPWHWL